MTNDPDNSPINVRDSYPAAPVEPNADTSILAERSIMAAPTQPPDPAWSGWDVLRLALLAAVVIFATGGLLLFTVSGATLRDRANHLNAIPELLLLAQMFDYVLLLGYMYILVTRERLQPRFWQALHWNWPSNAAFYLFVGVVMQAVFIVAEQFLPLPKETPFDALLQRIFSVYLLCIFSVTIGPLIEELFFRGFLYSVLKRRVGVVPAILATALLFALMHAAQYGNSWASVLLIFVVGVVLATVREKKDSLAASFLVHVAYNGTIMALIFSAMIYRHLHHLPTL